MISRTIVNNSRLPSVQLKKFIDNRKYAVQLKEDLDIENARLLHFLRITCEDLLWPGKKNYEVQVSFDRNTGLLIIGYNVGNRNELPNMQGPQDGLAEQINTALIKQYPTLKVWVKNVVIVRSSLVGIEYDNSVHAEQMIILYVLRSMLEEIKNNKSLTSKDINIRGKKYTCVSCKAFISKLDKDENINKYLKIHTPTTDVFNETGSSTATSHSCTDKWRNALSTGLGTLLTEAKTQANTIIDVETKDKIEKFIGSIKTLSEWSPT